MEKFSTSSNSSITFEFNGKADEYFRIWIVNICLTILTLGLYWPWAKVRHKRYFYGSTRLANSSFDYVANPWKMFKGQLIALSLLAISGFVEHFFPSFVILFWLIIIIALPWLVIRTLRFNAYNTLYRNIRFGFHSDYFTALSTYILLPILTLLSLGLASPWVVSKQKKFLVNNHRYGKSPFRLDIDAMDILMIFVESSVFSVFLMGLAAVIFGIISLLMKVGGILDMNILASFDKILSDQLGQQLESSISLGVILLLFLLFIASVVVFNDVTLFNLKWNKTKIANIQFRSQLKYIPMLRLYLTNILAILFSFGLLIPWAKIRVTRYRLESLSIMCSPEELNGFTSNKEQAIGALGEELSDFLDVDIGM